MPLYLLWRLFLVEHSGIFLNAIIINGNVYLFTFEWKLFIITNANTSFLCRWALLLNTEHENFSLCCPEPFMHNPYTVFGYHRAHEHIDRISRYSMKIKARTNALVKSSEIEIYSNCHMYNVYSSGATMKYFEESFTRYRWTLSTRHLWAS